MSVVPRLALLALAACSSSAAPTVTPQPAPAADARAPVAGVIREVVFEGMCDASGAVAISDRLFVVADDEDNVLRTYDADRGGAPLAAIDISPQLGIQPKGKKKPRPPELDLEAATSLGDRAYWLSSHGRSSKGKRRDERLRFFATTLPAQAGDPIAVVGGGYELLLDDLLADPQLAGYDLASAATLAPKDPGGFNIEGLTATPGGTLLIAFRNPVPGGRALMVPLLNAAEIIDAPDRTRARFGAPIELDLGGRGVRSLSWWRDDYLIVAGHFADQRMSALYHWSGSTPPTIVTGIDLTAYNPEGFFTPESRAEILLLSDDGTVMKNGVPCKKLDPAEKRFRGIWIAPDPAPR